MTPTRSVSATSSYSNAGASLVFLSENLNMDICRSIHFHNNNEKNSKWFSRFFPPSFAGVWSWVQHKGQRFLSQHLWASSAEILRRLQPVREDHRQGPNPSWLFYYKPLLNTCMTRVVAYNLIILLIICAGHQRSWRRLLLRLCATPDRLDQESETRERR